MFLMVILDFFDVCLCRIEFEGFLFWWSLLLNGVASKDQVLTRAAQLLFFLPQKSSTQTKPNTHVVEMHKDETNHIIASKLHGLQEHPRTGVRFFHLFVGSKNCMPHRWIVFGATFVTEELAVGTSYCRVGLSKAVDTNTRSIKGDSFILFPLKPRLFEDLPYSIGTQMVQAALGSDDSKLPTYQKLLSPCLGTTSSPSFLFLPFSLAFHVLERLGKKSTSIHRCL